MNKKSTDQGRNTMKKTNWGMPVVISREDAEHIHTQLDIRISAISVDEKNPETIERKENKLMVLQERLEQAITASETTEYVCEMEQPLELLASFGAIRTQSDRYVDALDNCTCHNLGHSTDN